MGTALSCETKKTKGESWRGEAAHWEVFCDGVQGDYHGTFARWNPYTCDCLMKMHLRRKYVLAGEGDQAVVTQANQMFMDDGKVVDRGPWAITKSHSNDKGVTHPRVPVPGFTTVSAQTDGCKTTAWVGHAIVDSNAVEKPGTLQTGSAGKGYEGQGHMVELIFKNGKKGKKFSIGYAYDAHGVLQHSTWNREDLEWPSKRWGTETTMTELLPGEASSSLGVTDVSKASVVGHQLQFDPDISQRPLSSKWQGHLASLQQPDVLVRSLPDGMVLVMPPRIPFGRDWSASFMWRPLDEEAVHTVELRYKASGEFDCLRYLKFNL